MNKIAPPLLISLKPDYADLVFQGLKTAELRRRISGDIINRDVYVYVSSPVKTLRGGFRVGQVWSGSPDQIWSEVSRIAGVSRQVFDDYYHGTNVAFAIQIMDVWEYVNPRSLDDLRRQFPGFVVPQSYRYAKAEEYRSFRSLKRIMMDVSNCMQHNRSRLQAAPPPHQDCGPHRSGLSRSPSPLLEPQT